MSVELKVPDVGESINEVQLGPWSKADGDRVEKDEDLVELETEKASMALPSPEAGTLRILKEEGEFADVGEVIGKIEQDGDAEQDADDTEEEDRAGGAEEADADDRDAEEDADEVDGGDAEDGGDEEKGQEDADEETAADEARHREPDEDVDTDEEDGDEEPRIMPAARRLLDEHDLQPDQVEATGPGGRLTKEDVLRHVGEIEEDEEGAAAQEAEEEDEEAPAGAEADEKDGEDEPEEEKRPAQEEEARAAARAAIAGTERGTATTTEPAPGPADVGEAADERGEDVQPMSMLRRTIAKRLVAAQQDAALLTTFNEIDMGPVKDLRARFKEEFEEKHGVRLGFMSFFVKAAVQALRRFPAVNAEVRETDVVYKNYYDIGIAIGSGKGLIVPVLRNADRMGFARIELAIAELAERAQDNQIKPEELEGGTFTISNGGIYGSLLSTPIVNPPQSGILGMHAIQDRPVARDGEVVVRPMMYVALTYDHRIVDGREAVTFLRTIKEAIEEPSRLMLDL